MKELRERNAHPITWLPRLKSQAGVSNRLPVKKNQRFPDFLPLAVPLRCGGGGDRRWLRFGSTGLCSENTIVF